MRWPTNDLVTAVAALGWLFAGLVALACVWQEAGKLVLLILV